MRPLQFPTYSAEPRNTRGIAFSNVSFYVALSWSASALSPGFLFRDLMGLSLLGYIRIQYGSSWLEPKTKPSVTLVARSAHDVFGLQVPVHDAAAVKVLDPWQKHFAPMKIHVYTCIYTVYTCIYTCICVHICTHIHTYICTYVFIYARKRVYRCVYVYMYMCRYIYIYM